MIKAYYDLYILLLNLILGFFLNISYNIIFSKKYKLKLMFELIFSLIFSFYYIHIYNKYKIDFRTIHLLFLTSSILISNRLFKKISIRLSNDFKELLKGILIVLVKLSKSNIIFIVILTIRKDNQRRKKLKELF